MMPLASVEITAKSALLSIAFRKISVSSRADWHAGPAVESRARASASSTADPSPVLDMSGFSRLQAASCILQNTATQHLKTYVQLSSSHLCLDCLSIVSDTRATRAVRHLCAV